MTQMINDLNKVLVEKNFGNNENELILHSFKILLNHFDRQTDKLLEYIENINSLGSFKIITDVNTDEFLKSQIIKLDSMIIESRDQISKYSRGIRFRKEDNKYILDKNGEYILETAGYCDRYAKEKSVAIFNLPSSNTLNFIHEYEHTTQKGFTVPAMYFASAELEFILREGDAMDLPLRALKEDEKLQKDIVMNAIPYFREFHLFSNLKILLGQEFIENWKSNPKIDFMKQVRNIFKEKFSEEVLQEIMAIIFGVSIDI